MASMSLEERIVRIERTCEYLATKESVAIVNGKVEATDRVLAIMRWELHAILALCVAITGILVTVLVRTG